MTSSIDRGSIARIQSHFRIALRCAISAVLVSSAYAGAASPPAIAPAIMPRIGTVDQRFQSYNIEMVEITGGRFWKPYRTKPGAEPAQTPRSGSDTPPGMDSRLYQYRPPIDLTNPRLRKLAAALGACLCARQRHLGKHHLFCRFGPRAVDASRRIQERLDPSAMAERGRFFADRWTRRSSHRSHRARAPAMPPASGRRIRPTAFSPIPARLEVASPPLNS